MSLGRVLVVAAHFDDEVIGAGGLMARADQAMAVVMCDPWMKDVPQTESLNASLHAVEEMRKAGIAYRRRGLRDELLDLRDAIGTIETSIQTWDPDTVVCHWRGDMNQDHRTVAQAAVIACRPTRARRVSRFLAMEVVSSTNWGMEPIGDAGVYVPFDWPVKALMLDLYQHVLTPDRSPAVLEANAKVRGAAAGVDHAEFFRVLWEVAR